MDFESKISLTNKYWWKKCQITHDDGKNMLKSCATNLFSFWKYFKKYYIDHSSSCNSYFCKKKELHMILICTFSLEVLFSMTKMLLPLSRRLFWIKYQYQLHCLKGKTRFSRVLQCLYWIIFQAFHELYVILNQRAILVYANCHSLSSHICHFPNHGL